MASEGSGPRPVELELKRTKELIVRWDDGHISVYPLVQLRAACPCAACKTARQERTTSKLVVLRMPSASAADMATVVNADLVGNYAIKFEWKDGHATGIYDYRLLRSLCSCETCRQEHSQADLAE
jgi:DUF971 family protein